MKQFTQWSGRPFSWFREGAFALAFLTVFSSSVNIWLMYY